MYKNLRLLTLTALIEIRKWYPLITNSSQCSSFKGGRISWGISSRIYTSLVGGSAAEITVRPKRGQSREIERYYSSDLSRNPKAGPAGWGEGGGPIAAERALDGAPAISGAQRANGRTLPKRLPKKAEDDGGNAWRGVFSPALSGRLAYEKRVPPPPPPQGCCSTVRLRCVCCASSHRCRRSAADAVVATAVAAAAAATSNQQRASGRSSRDLAGDHTGDDNRVPQRAPRPKLDPTWPDRPIGPPPLSRSRNSASGTLERARTLARTRGDRAVCGAHNASRETGRLLLCIRISLTKVPCLDKADLNPRQWRYALYEMMSAKVGLISKKWMNGRQARKKDWLN